MAVNLAPSHWFNSWTLDGDNIVVPVISLSEAPSVLSNAEAHGTTGDIREVIISMCERLYTGYSDTEVADRPPSMVISKIVQQTANPKILTSTYVFKFETSTILQDVYDA